MNTPMIFPYLVCLSEGTLIVSGHISAVDARRNAQLLSAETSKDIQIWENGSHILTYHNGRFYGSDRI